MSNVPQIRALPQSISIGEWLAPNIERDASLAAQFDRRLSKFFALLLCVYAILLVVYAPLAELNFTIIHAFMFLITAGLFAAIKDRFLFFLVSNTAWFWSFSTYLYAATHLKPIEDGLFSPIRASLLGLLLLIASALAAGFVHLFKIGSPAAFLRSAAAMTVLSRFRGLIVAVGLVSLSITAIFPNPTVSSIAGAISFMTWLGLALELRAVRGRFTESGLLWIAFGFAAVVALALNGRSVLFSFGLFLIFAYLIFAPRVWNAGILIVAYVAFGAFTAFSDAQINVRSTGILGSGRSALWPTVEKFASFDTLQTILFPFGESAIRRETTDRILLSLLEGSFGTRYFGLDSGFITRLINLPYADSVCGLSGAIDRIRWDRLGDIFVNAMPYVGIGKTEGYADIVTWDMGLRDVGNVGFPMITSVCELYTMGGWTFAFVASFIFMALIVFWYRVFLDALGSRVFLILIFSQFAISLTFTTAIITMLVPVIRGFPTTLLALFLLKGVGFAMKAR